jgi:hypothetical protein
VKLQQRNGQTCCIAESVFSLDGNWYPLADFVSVSSRSAASAACLNSNDQTSQCIALLLESNTNRLKWVGFDFLRALPPFPATPDLPALIAVGKVLTLTHLVQGMQCGNDTITVHEHDTLNDLCL